MKKSDFPGQLSTIVHKFKALFSRQDPTVPRAATVVDISHMLKREPGSPVHLLYVLLFGTALIAALWQHGSAYFTFGTLFLLPGLGFFLYIPYRFANTLLRYILSCGIFFGACFWITFRLQNALPFDLALLEGLILCGFAFLINSTSRSYHYLFFITVFLLIYGGLVPRKLLLYLSPAVFLGTLLIFFAERKKYISGDRKLIFPAGYSRLRELGRSWPMLLLQLLIAFPIFLYTFSLFPLTDSGTEGYFEVSFITGRTNALPPDLRKWLHQDRKAFRSASGDLEIDGPAPVTSSAAARTVVSAPTSDTLSGRGGSPPGKDLLFTVQQPLKLYHLATLYDLYDGKAWHTTQAFHKSRLLRRRTFNYSFDVTGKYTIVKWISPQLYAPYRPLEFQQVFPENTHLTNWPTLFRHLHQTSFNAKLKKIKEYPPVPFRYNVRSQLTIPRIPQVKKPGEKTAPPPKLYDTLESFLSIQQEKEKEKQAKAALAAAKAKAARERREKLAAARRKAAAKRADKAVRERKARLEAARKKAAAKNKSARKKAQVKKSTVKKAVLKKRPVPAIARKTPVKVKPRIVRFPFDPAWQEALPKTHFIQLPPDLSPKIKALGDSLTAGKLLPYEKAIALRDYLRQNYQYKLYASPTPPGKESVAYFLFELKEGHCEYFAAALTVLARTQNLPARVATGFSPGNYNALSKQFEVYEYHAHAWTQIYIEKLGWLTFDAVPPGEIPSATTPVGLGRLRDPFGNDWQITPPELTVKAFELAQNLFEKDQKIREAERQKRLQAQQKKLKKQLQKDPSGDQKKALKKVRKIPKVRNVTLSEKIKTFFNIDPKRLLPNFLQHLSIPRGMGALTLPLASFILLLAAVLLFRKRIKKCFYFWRYKKLLAQARLDVDTAPEKSLLSTYKALRLLLLWGDMPRQNNQELLTYAEHTQQLYLKSIRHRKKTAFSLSDQEEKSQRFSACIRQVFTAFYALEYGRNPVDPAEAEKQISSLVEIFQLLRELENSAHK